MEYEYIKLNLTRSDSWLGALVSVQTLVIIVT